MKITLTEKDSDYLKIKKCVSVNAWATMEAFNNGDLFCPILLADTHIDEILFLSLLDDCNSYEMLEEVYNDEYIGEKHCPFCKCESLILDDLKLSNINKFFLSDDGNTNKIKFFCKNKSCRVVSDYFGLYPSIGMVIKENNKPYRYRQEVLSRNMGVRIGELYYEYAYKSDFAFELMLSSMVKIEANAKAKQKKRGNK